MSNRLQDRVFAACGIASVVVELAGTFVSMADGTTHRLTFSSGTAAIAKAFATPASTAVWVGAYLELVSFGLFLAFAVWACEKLGGGMLGSIGRAAATAYVAVSVASLSVLNAMAYLAGDGIGIDTARTLVILNGALFVATWFLTAFFLLAVGPLALRGGRRVVGWSAIGVAAFTLVGVAAAPADAGQLSSLLALVWVAAASAALVRAEPERRAVAAVA